MKTNRLLIAVATFIIISAAGACTDELDISTPTDNGEIKFGVSVTDCGSNPPISRANGTTGKWGEMVSLYSAAIGDSLYMLPEVTDMPDMSGFNKSMSRGSTVNSSGMYSTFAVSAYYYTDSWDNGHSIEQPNYFISQEVAKMGDSYAITPTRYWPSDGKMRFLAYAPVDNSNYTYYSWISDPSNPRGSYIHIDVPQNAAEQEDLLVAYTAEINCKGRATGSTPLNFKHALAGVKFNLKSDMAGYRLKKVTINNVVSRGDFLFDIQTASEQSSADTDISSKCSLWGALDGYSTYMDYTDGDTDEHVFFMLPQWIEEAPIDIVLETTDGTNETYSLSGSIKNSLWQMGKLTTYNITFSDNGLEVTEPSVFDYKGQIFSQANNSFAVDNPVTVTSFKRNEADPWTVTYKEPGKAASSTCDWLSYTQEEVAGSPYSTIVKFHASSTPVNIDIDANLQNAATKGSTGTRYNLANANGTANTVTNTANCYIVGAKGYYILPLVYGNAIQNGTTNESYKFTGSGSNFLTTFKNHLGNAITSPYITDNANCVAAGAKLIWQDEQNLVSSVALDKTAYGGKGGLTFNIGSDIKQGNAVIAVVDNNGDVMWSWHIWVTNMGLDEGDNSIAIANNAGREYDIMPTNLGWCSSDSDGDGKNDAIKYYKKRTCEVTFTSASGNSQTITITQESHIAFPRGNNVYYQWGRKDPFVGTNVNWGNKPWYDGTGTLHGNEAPPRIYPDGQNDNRKTTIAAIDSGDLVKNPGKWHNPSGTELDTNTPSSSNQAYINLWSGNASYSGTQHAKTVYDPCPVGWQVADTETFTGFTTDGQNTTEDGSQTAKMNYVLRSDIPSGDPSLELICFYTDDTKIKSVVFPQTGYRDWNALAGVYRFGSETSAGEGRGFIWLAGNMDNHDSYNFKFAYQQFVQPRSAFFVCDGFPVRPCKTK